MFFSSRAVVSYWRKYVHEVLVNRLGGRGLPRKSVVRLTDRPDMTLDVYRGRKTTMQQHMFPYKDKCKTTVNPLYNDIRYNSKIHYNVRSAQKSADRVFFH